MPAITLSEGVETGRGGAPAPFRSGRRKVHTWSLRAASTLSMLGALAHVPMVGTHMDSGFASSVVALAALACILCAIHLWWRPDLSSARMTMSMGLAMVLAHAMLVATPMSHSAHHGAAVSRTGALSTAAFGPMMVAIGLELLAAAVCAAVIRVNRARVE